MSVLMDPAFLLVPFGCLPVVLASPLYKAFPVPVLPLICSKFHFYSVFPVFLFCVYQFCTKKKRGSPCFRWNFLFSLLSLILHPDFSDSHFENFSHFENQNSYFENTQDISSIFRYRVARLMPSSLAALFFPSVSLPNSSSAFRISLRSNSFKRVILSGRTSPLASSAC